jgi:hypothetical protein
MSKTITKTVYTALELRELFPIAFDSALEKWKQSQSEPAEMSDIVHSFKAIFKAFGCNLIDYYIEGDYPRNYVKFTIPVDWSELADNDSLVDDYTGQRAYKWIKDQLGIKSFERVNYSRRDGQGFYYNIIRNDGKVMSRPFTGYYADDYFLYNLLNDIKEGHTLREAFSDLADCAAKMIEDELAFQQSEENFIDYTESNKIFFDENGEMFK